MSAHPFSMRATPSMGLIALVTSLSCALAGQDLVLRVPFDFRVGETHFGPGEYILAMDRASTGSVTIQSADRRRGAVVHTRKSRAAAGRLTTPTVSFRAYGDSRFLSAVQAGGVGDRWDLPPTADEAALIRTKGQPKVTSLRAEILEKK